MEQFAPSSRPKKNVSPGTVEDIPMKRLAAFALFPVLAFIFAIDSAPAADKGDSPKAALQSFNDYIGSWSGDGKAKKTSWAETVEWGWRFKGKDCWLTFKTKGGKFFKSGELKWLPEKKLYQFTAIDPKDEKLVLEGKIEKDYLTLNGTNPKTKEQIRLKMFNAGDGAFFNYRLEHARAGEVVHHRLRGPRQEGRRRPGQGQEGAGVRRQRRFGHDGDHLQRPDVLRLLRRLSRRLQR